MSRTYTPGLMVSRRRRYRVRRLLPLTGEVLVRPGDQVKATDVVARAMLPGDVIPINLASALSIPPGELPRAMLCEVGSELSPGRLVAKTQGIFGFFSSEYHAKNDGIIESVSSITGQLMLRGPARPLQLLAFLAGEVVEIRAGSSVTIESEAAFIQGIFGVGGETYGVLRMACEEPDAKLTAAQILPDMRGQIIVGGGRVTGDAVQRAIGYGVAAIISGGLDDADLHAILGYDLGVAVTGSEQIGITLIITEGFGDIAMADRTFALLHNLAGREAAVNGATQIRAGVMRPEIVVPLGPPEPDERPVSGALAANLDIGCQVRLIRDPYFGELGEVVELPAEPVTLESESKARIVRVKRSGGDAIVVPRANVEIIEQ